MLYGSANIRRCGNVMSVGLSKGGKNMYGYLQSDPTRVVLLEPIVPGTSPWYDGYRFCARRVEDGEEQIRIVTPYEIYGIIPIEEVLTGVI